jgi:hypothetical protein
MKAVHVFLLLKCLTYQQQHRNNANASARVWQNEATDTLKWALEGKVKRKKRSKGVNRPTARQQFSLTNGHLAYTFQQTNFKSDVNGNRGNSQKDAVITGH